MAFIDYGAVAFKNGKCIQGSMFGDMLSMVGWREESLDGDFFSFVGDKDFTVCFYKTYMKIIGEEEVKTVHLTSNFIGWKRYEDILFPANSDEIVVITVTPRQRDCYTFKMKYKGDKYKVIFGYGIDYGYWLKTGIFNYYCCPEHFFKSTLPRFFKDIPYNIELKYNMWVRKRDRQKQEKARKQKET
jgi:hypothetical protein|nr:MAG TPA: hypothetical protein [Caudoviricetes sp.]